MELKRGLWLILLDEAGEETPVACLVEEQRDDVWRLEAMIPPQVYPATFVEARLRLDGHYLGRLVLARPVTTRTHEPQDLSLEIPIIREQYALASRGR